MNKSIQHFALIFLFTVGTGNFTSAAPDRTTAAHDPMPTKIPDHIILTWSDDPATTQSVTWRTDTSIVESYGEIARADASPNFIHYTNIIDAKTENFLLDDYCANYHSITFTNLHPNTLYLYRVGSEDNWRSEWFQFRTASRESEPFTFIYLGDGQNNLLSMWSRSIRGAYSAAPDARFIIHAGDLVSFSDSYLQWSKWFEAAGWINGMAPSIPVPGNHEYYHGSGKKRYLTDYWRPQFTLPENGIDSLPESNYYIDFQGLRILAMNSNEHLEEQAEWLETVLKDNPNRWTIATFHHTIYAATVNRDHKKLRETWKPLFDKYHVDLVLAGHDHAYSRGHNIDPNIGISDPQTGTVYVVSVSGPKMYDLTDDRWMDRAAENTQLYQVISVDQKTLSYRSYTVTGELYDAFQVIKKKNKPNKIIDQKPQNFPERTFQNTLSIPK
ncbi:MAG: metallophosphoesterase family protein [Candidatus Marinimicrobia bacterium]|nr:metallophosphoesterase family protein [Candidatus Neomarinimicrobiota bacterium]MBL7066648.1 metallophosphoesterase family protein [Candidatus Neomarinimicrobiota bacterium]